MDIIGVEATGAGVQADQPAALGEKKEGAGGLFGLVLARLAGDGEADENEGEGADQRSTDAAGPVSLAGLLLPAALQQVEPSASPVPTSVSADAPDTALAVALVIEDGLGQGGASAGSLPYVPPTPDAPLAPGADQAGESPSSPQSRRPGESRGPGASLPLDSHFRGNDVGEMGNGDESARVTQMPDSGVRRNDETSLSDETSETAPAEPAFTEAQAGAQHKPSSPHAGSGDPSSPTVLDSRFRGNDEGERGNDEGERGNGEQSAGVTSTLDADVRRNDGTSVLDEAGATALVEPPAANRLPFGNEKLAAENLSAPPTASSTAASSPALSKAVPPVPDPAPVAGSAFQRDTLQIQLAPTELGRITVQVSVHARQVQAAVSVEHQGLGAYLAVGQGALDDAVRQHGLRIEEFRVDLLDLGAGRTGQEGYDSPEFQGHQGALPGRPESVAVPSAPAASLSENEPADATAPQRLNVFA